MNLTNLSNDKSRKKTKETKEKKLGHYCINVQKSNKLAMDQLSGCRWSWCEFNKHWVESFFGGRFSMGDCARVLLLRISFYCLLFVNTIYSYTALVMAGDGNECELGSAATSRQSQQLVRAPSVLLSRHAQVPRVFQWSSSLRRILSALGICNILPCLFLIWEKRKEKTALFGDFRVRPHWTDLVDVGFVFIFFCCFILITKYEVKG